MDTQTKIQLHSKGIIFEKGMQLENTIAILDNFNKAYSYCLKKQQRKFTSEKIFLFDPQINIRYLKKGSLLSLITIDFPSIYAMVGPEIAKHAWEMFKLTFEFAKFYISTIKKEQRIPDVNIENSPGACVHINMNTGSQIFNDDIMGAYKTISPYISNIAEHVGPSGMKFFDIKRIGEHNRVLDKIRIDMENRDELTIEQKEINFDEPRDFRCKIYSINTKTKRGKLDILEEFFPHLSLDNCGSVTFAIEYGDISQYVRALNYDEVYIKAKFSMMLNAFGESKIICLYPVEIHLP